MESIPYQAFYFIRHGQTDANKNHQMWGGDWDLPLNETGRQQAQVTAQEQSELLATVDLIYVRRCLKRVA